MRIEINRLGINGEGVGKITEGENAGKVIFVDNALPNEICEVDVIKNAKKFCVGHLKELLKASDIRENPPCKYYGICGGCHLQHVKFEHQKQFKIDNVKSTIKKIAGLDVDIDEYVSFNEFGYRNKMVFPVSYVNGKTIIGMFEGESHKVVEIDKCLLAREEINKILQQLKDIITSNYTGYDFKNKSGDIKYLVIRNHNEKSLITIVAAKKIDLSSICDVLRKHFKNVGISLLISDNDDEIMSGKYYHIMGLEGLEFDELGVNYTLDNRGFLQVNNEVKEKLYEKVLENLTEEDIVLDGYSGAGLLSGIISKKSAKVVGIEINHSACESARKLIKTNNLQNVEYFEGDVQEHLDSAISKGVNTVVLDPPRSGCSKEILEKINQTEDINKLIYISCNPATLSRDLSVLKGNFDIVNVSLFDMFANTKHVETLVCLQRRV